MIGLGGVPEFPQISFRNYDDLMHENSWKQHFQSPMIGRGSGRRKPLMVFWALTAILEGRRK
jgi:hypothetical protein